ncbi:hypothetical protein SAMN05421809_2429 [Natronorubrum daqingense]|uniref:Uncharacterized protein n=1 Tax=Natronorubrum daqingense TaxID=588898 RepID=A0A1N7E3E6_9EURY|nr:hypothetical protein BB347_06720 [Natronorubrum daqingense]SIR82561.1 hypothetical protein SAMN05421809_2429 [Natronorubrum daqingense]
MGGDDETSRLMATCVECKSVFAALEFPNGTIQPIGSRDGCTSCGATEFEPLPEPSFDFDETDT